MEGAHGEEGGTVSVWELGGLDVLEGKKDWGKATHVLGN